ncbi:MAG: hypothetical protein E7295_13100 [Lachnospiraceae bacterium]|jgi:hypothetical protein|nr:hypothetical protein [Lachnospiraceae bacterium]
MGYVRKETTGEERRILGREIFPPMDRLKLPEALRCERLRQEVMEDISRNPEMLQRYREMRPEDREMLMEFFMGNRGLNILYDPFFKKIMNQERLERFLSQVMGQEVSIVRILPPESVRHSEEGSVMIMDMIVKLSDGSYVDLEIQRISVKFPFERAVCYASDMVVRQYEQLKHEQKQAQREWREWNEERGKGLQTNEPEPKVEFNYQSIRPVHVIVIMNSSTRKFREFEENYIHRTADFMEFDTGLRERAIQKFIFVSLDIFRRIRDNKIETKMTELEAWMYFLASDRPEDITRLINEYPEFEEAYLEINQFRRKPEEMMSMISEAIRILDEGDAKLQIEMLHEELDQAIKEKDDAIKEKDDAIKAKEQIQALSQRQGKELVEIREANKQKDDLIEELKRQIEHLKRM